MNTGTRIRTALAVALALYTAFIKTDVTDFGNATVDLIYQICMKIVTFVVIFLITYYNNDYTVEMDTHTKLGRQEKALRGYVPETAEEPEDADADESEVQNGNE